MLIVFFLILPLAGVLPAFSYEAHPDFGLSITRLDEGVGVGDEVVSFIADHLKKTKINGKVLSDYFIMEESSELYGRITNIHFYSTPLMLNEPDLTVGDLETVLIKALCQEYPESSGYHISHPYVRSDLVGSFMVSSEKGIVYESADVHPVAMFIKKYLAATQLNGEPLNGYLSPEMLEIGYDKDRPTHRLTVTFYISPEYKEFILKHNKGLPGTYPIRGKSICDPEPPQELGDAFFSLLSEIHREFDSKEFSIAVAG